MLTKRKGICGRAYPALDLFGAPDGGSIVGVPVGDFVSVIH